MMISLLVPALCQGQVFFQQTFGTNSCNEEGRSLAVGTDKSFYVAGNRVCGNNPRKPLLYKFTNQGDTISTSLDLPFNGWLTSHDSSLYTFYGDGTFPDNQDSIHLFRVRIDSGIRWQKSFFKGVCNNTATQHVTTTDQHTLFTGFYSFKNCGSPLYNSFYGLISPGGTLQWLKNLKGSQNEQLHNARETPDGGFALAGWTDSRSSGRADFLLVKTNSDGDTLWTRTYGSAQANKCYGLEVTPDSGFFLLGQDDSVRLIKTDPSGQKEWERTLGKACGGRVYKIKRSQDGSYTALSLEQVAGQCQAVLYKLKPDGSVFWQRSFSKGRVLTYLERPDTSYVLAGYVYDTATFQSDLFVLGFDSTTFSKTTDGIAAPDSLQSEHHKLQIIPNPSSGQATIKLRMARKEKVESLTLYSANGEKLRTLDVQNRAKLRIHQGDLPSGLYFIRVHRKTGQDTTGKILFY